MSPTTVVNDHSGNFIDKIEDSLSKYIDEAYDALTAPDLE